jgi:hypothetical protein
MVKKLKPVLLVTFLAIVYIKGLKTKRGIGMIIENKSIKWKQEGLLLSKEFGSEGFM